MIGLDEEMAKKYLVFVDSLKDLPEDKEVELTIKDLTPGRRKYDARYVRARISSSPAKLPGADNLQVRFRMGVLHPDPYAIKITKELGELPPPIQVGKK